MRVSIIAAALLTAGPLFAADISVEDGFALVQRPGAPTGAVFMMMKNDGEETDRLVSASSSVAQRVELHTHIAEGDVIKMRPIEGGISIDANGAHLFERGGDHIMLMGLTEPLEIGSEIEVTLTFERAGDVVVSFPVTDGKDKHAHDNHGAGHGDH